MSCDRRSFLSRALAESYITPASAAVHDDGLPGTLDAFDVRGFVSSFAIMCSPVSAKRLR